MAFGLAAEQRLRCKAQFDAVFQEQNRLYSRHFLAYYRPNHLPFARLGVIASKKSVRLAVQRNRIRRLVKEQFRHKQALLPAFDMVVIVKKGTADISNQELSTCIFKLLKKVSTLRSA